MERVSFVQRARPGTGTSEASGASRQPLNAATQDGVDLQEVCSGLLHELPDLSEMLHSRAGARHDDRQGSASNADEGPRTDELRTSTEETVTAGISTYRVAKREERGITSRGNRQLGTRGREAGGADGGIGAQIDAAKARLARALKARNN